jgi:hypothetical protein
MEIDMNRKRVAAVIAVVVLLLGGGLAWWKLRGGAPAKPAVKDPWAAAKGIDEAAILAEKRAAHGDAPVDRTPASAAGRVTRKADGSGVAGAVVSLQPKGLGIENLGFPGASEKMVVVVADDTGAWIAPVVQPGDYVLTATSPGLLPGLRDDIALAAGAKRTGLDVALVAGGITVSGTVSDIGGGPIADARVRATRDDITALRGAAGGFVAITGVDGTYQLTLADGAWEARATQDDYTPSEKDFELRDQPMTIDFTLTPGAVVRGQVISRIDGQPVPGAVVRAKGGADGGRRGNDNESGTTVADDGGNFTLRGLGSGAIELTASGKGYASAAPTTVALGIGEEVTGVKVLVDRAYTISGFVVKKGDERKGIAGVTVGAFSLGTMEGAMSTQPSADDGYFEITGVHNANYLLFALGRDVMPEVGQPVIVKDADVTDVLVVMEIGATLSGRVEPGAVASLALEVDSENVGLSNMFDVIKAVMVGGSSDESGAFTIHNAPPGEFTLVARTKDGRTGKLPVTIAFTDQTGLVVPLESRAAIAGKVVDALGAPVGGVEVNARSTAAGRGMKIRLQEPGGTVTYPDGSFRIVGLDAGKYALTVSDDQGELAWAQNPGQPVEVEITGSHDVTGQTLTVEPRDGVIRGIVLGPDRQPAADAWVTATKAKVELAIDEGKKVTIEVGTGGSTVTEEGGDEDEEMSWSGYSAQDPVLTGPDGRFTITRLRRGAYDVIAEGGKGSQRARKTGIKTGESNVTLVLEPLGSLSGTVTSSGAPVKDYTIICRGPAGSDTKHVLDDAGAYVFDRRPPGKYTCTVTSELGTATGEATVKAAAKLDLTIGAWASIAGVVINAMTGAPMPGLKLAAVGATGVPTGIEDLITGGGPTTDDAGAFEIGKQTAGKGNLMVFGGGLMGIHIVANREYTLSIGQRLDLGTIKGLAPRLGPAGTLGLSVTDTDNKLTVTAVVPAGPAERAGVKAGDVIVAIDDKPVPEITLELASKALTPEHVSAGQTIKLGLTRGSTPLELPVVADAVPETP